MKSKKSYQCLLCTMENQSNSVVGDWINYLITAHPWKLREIEKERIPLRTFFILVSSQPDPPLSNLEFLILKKYWCDWNNINFGTNTFKIHVDGIVSIPIFCKGCIPKFNDIKQEFFKKLNDKSLFQFYGKRKYSAS